MRKLLSIFGLIVFIFISCKKPLTYKTEKDVSMFEIDLILFGNQKINDSTSIMGTHSLYNKDIEIPTYITSKNDFEYYFSSPDSSSPGYIMSPYIALEETDYDNYMIHQFSLAGSKRLTNLKVSYHKKDKVIRIFRKEEKVYQDSDEYTPPVAHFIRIPNKYQDYTLEYKIRTSVFTH